MITKPIQDNPPSGMLAFGNNLMVRFHDDNRFYVYNGHWEGVYDGELIFIEATENYMPAQPFEEVTEITKAEREQWFMDAPIIIPECDYSTKIPF